MVLEQFNIPSATGLTSFLNNRLIPQLESAVDLNGKPINMSVALGIDTVLQSAINGTPAADEMPCIRIFYDPNTITIGNAQNVALFQNIPLSLYFIYAYDFPSTNFSALRDAHIRWNLNYLKMNVFSDNIGFRYESWWKWMNESPALPVQHNTTLRYLGRTISLTPEANYTVSRIDLNVMIKNYLSAAEVANL